MLKVKEWKIICYANINQRRAVVVISDKVQAKTVITDKERHYVIIKFTKMSIHQVPIHQDDIAILMSVCMP